MNKNKTALIIDGGYIIKNPNRNFKIDYLKLKSVLSTVLGSQISESYFFNSYNVESFSTEQDRFHNWLKTSEPIGPRFQVKLYPLRTIPISCESCGLEYSKHIQKGVDVGIATTMFELSYNNRADTIVLVAGDGDFIDALFFLKTVMNQRIVVCGYRNTMSLDIQSMVDKIIWLEDIQDDISKG